MLAIRLIFSRPQPEEPILVQTTVVDKISWYRALIQEEREKNSKVARTAISTRIVKYYTEVSCFPDYLQIIDFLSYIWIPRPLVK